MAKELILRPLLAKARLHLALEENANLRTRIDALEAQLAELAAENERLKEALEGIDSIITNGINENGSDYHRVKIGEEWYDGPVVDVLHKILMGLREIVRAALKGPASKSPSAS